MRTTFVHEALLSLDTAGDERAPGGAVTLELCGSWDHPGPCPVAPHHTAVHREGAAGDLRVRVLFACDPAGEDAVRRRVVEALGTGELVGPDGASTRWDLRRHGPGVVLADELEHAERLTGEP
ncbi:hypothetical protein [Oryzobacter terrae]|uniref:hypothetical protein n=1 Tax=Oryzobacter terrae TaxID=1620385 RepID=UPI00366B59BA